MPEYLAPGVYVEETSFRSKSIEGVSTTTTGFIGPTRFGPYEADPEIITSLDEFERTYGDGGKLTFGTGPDALVMDNWMWHAARAFFTEGGKRLYVSRVFRANGSDGHATWSRGGTTIRARFPGSYGNLIVRVTAKSGANILGRVKDDSQPGGFRTTLGAVRDRDVVWVRDQLGDMTSPPTAGDVHLVRRQEGDPPTFSFAGAIGSPIASPLTTRDIDALVPDPQPGQGDSVRVITLTVEVVDGRGETLGVWPDLPIDPAHMSGGRADSLFSVFHDGDDARTLPIVFDAPSSHTGLDVLADLFDDTASNPFADGDALQRGVPARSIVLDQGSDGLRPGSAEYAGRENPDELVKTGLKQLAALEDISIVAAPGITWNYSDENYQDDANTIIGMLIGHARDMRYRIAVLDSAQNQSISDVRKMRAKIDSKYAALYYPWVRIFDPITRSTITAPPSGFVAGIYARNDIERAVYKAPANEVVNLAIGFERMISKAQQEVLNPEGINCFRFFEGRGMLVWGARTVSSDPEWKYVNLRRYFAYLERSIDRGTQWAVFEPNGERLWANVRRTIEDFLFNEWVMGALLGDKPEKAYFVKCDRTTMTQNDLDNGRLVCKIGVAALRPAEFVIFRIGQWTADHKV